MKQNQLIYHHIHHPIIDLTLFVNKDASVLAGISFGIQTEFKGMPAQKFECLIVQNYVESIKKFLDKNNKSLVDIPLDLSWCTKFQRSVLLAAQTIPWGNVVTYSNLAIMAQYPKAIRAVASVMRNNRFPLVIPCHRVIGKNGKIGRFMGETAGKYILLKRDLLANEGVKIG